MTNDIAKEFFKLQGYPIPVPENHLHYIEVLDKDQYGVEKKWKQYQSYVESLLSKGFKSPQSYFRDHALRLFIDWANTHMSPVLSSSDYKPNNVLRRKDERRKYEDDIFVLNSYDIVKANSSVALSLLQPSDAPKDWAELCDLLGIHEFLADSKYFRQICWGNTNPKRLSTMQCSLTEY